MESNQTCLSMDSSGSAELDQLIAQETKKYEAKEMVKNITKVCWGKCITAAPGDNLSSSESTCLHNCAQRYMDVSLLIMKRFQSM